MFPFLFDKGLNNFGIANKIQKIMREQQKERRQSHIQEKEE